MNTLRLIFLSTTLAGFLSAHAANHGDKHKPAKKGSASAAEVSYVGSLDDEPIFHIAYNNSTGSRFSIRLLDADGHILYQGIFTDRTFSKKFRIATTELSGKLTFVVRNFQDQSEQNFQVESNTRTVEDVEVREIK